jgi:hypothetical protein
MKVNCYVVSRLVRDYRSNHIHCHSLLFHSYQSNNAALPAIFRNQQISAGFDSIFEKTV